MKESKVKIDDFDWETRINELEKYVDSWLLNLYGDDSIQAEHYSYQLDRVTDYLEFIRRQLKGVNSDYVKTTYVVDGK